MLRLSFSCLLWFYTFKAKVRLVVVSSMCSLDFEVLPMVLCLLALFQTIRILLLPEKSIEQQLLVSISALRVHWQSVMDARTRSGFDLISLFIAWGRRAESWKSLCHPLFFLTVAFYWSFSSSLGSLSNLKGTAVFSGVFVENLMLTGSNTFKQLSLKPFCHGWTVSQADCIVQSKGMESDFMFWLICR